MALKTVTTDIPRELAPVVLMITQPYLLVVTPALPVGNYDVHVELSGFVPKDLKAIANS